MGDYTITPPPVPQANNNAGKKKTKRRWPLFLGMSTLFLIVAGICVYFFFLRGFTLSQSHVSFESDGGVARIEVNGPSNWRIIGSVPSWVYTSRVDNDLIITVSESDVAMREATIKIGNGNKTTTLSVHQDSGAFYASQYSQIVDGCGGTASYTINGQTDWVVQVGPEYWGSVTQSGSTLNWTVDENFGDERQDQIKLKAGSKELYLTIVQRGGLRTDNSSLLSESSSSHVKRINIYGPDNWNCNSNVWWMSVSRDGNQLRIDFDKNEYSDSRSGTITVSGGGQTINIEVTQNAKSSGGYYYYW